MRRIIADVYRKSDKNIQIMEIECSADSDDEESELEELENAESVHETEISDNDVESSSDDFDHLHQVPLTRSGRIVRNRTMDDYFLY